MSWLYTLSFIAPFSVVRRCFRSAILSDHALYLNIQWPQAGWHYQWKKKLFYFFLLVSELLVSHHHFCHSKCTMGRPAQSTQQNCCKVFDNRVYIYAYHIWWCWYISVLYGKYTLHIHNMTKHWAHDACKYALSSAHHSCFMQIHFFFIFFFFLLYMFDII